MLKEENIKNISGAPADFQSALVVVEGMSVRDSCEGLVGCWCRIG